MFVNFERSVKESGTLAALQTEEDEDGLQTQSDHRVSYAKIYLRRTEAFRWEEYSYRHYDDQAEASFGEWVIMHGWEEVRDAEGADGKAIAYQGTVQGAIDRFFPLKKNKKKSTDFPWMCKAVRDQIRQRKGLYMAEGGVRTQTWKEAKKDTDAFILKRKRGFLDKQKEHILAEDANRNFYKHVRNFFKLERPKLFDVRDLLEGMTDQEAAEHLAVYFDRISQEFDPLTQEDIPFTYQAGIPILRTFEVASRIRRFRKPKSMVPGDIFLKLVTKFSDFLAIPLTMIYNEISRTLCWPAIWKKEFVTVIPKKTNPRSLGDLRNISCTMLASKMYESYILDWLKEEVSLRPNQYGGIKGLSTEHVLSRCGRKSWKILKTTGRQQ